MINSKQLIKTILTKYLDITLIEPINIHPNNKSLDVQILIDTDDFRSTINLTSEKLKDFEPYFTTKLKRFKKIRYSDKGYIIQLSLTIYLNQNQPAQTTLDEIKTVLTLHNIYI